MRYVVLLSTVLVLVASAVYVYRWVATDSAEAEPPGSVAFPYEPQVEGRLVSPIRLPDGTNLCEFDARVVVRSGTVERVIAGSPLAPAEGSVVAGVPDEWSDEAMELPVFRNESGAYELGCAPESVKISEGPAPEPGPLGAR